MNTAEYNDVIDMHVATQLMSHKRKGQSAFERLLPIFVEESNMLVEQLRCAIAAADNEGLRLTAHKLKGSASVLGALRVRALSQAVMENVDAGLPTLPEHIAALESEISRFRQVAYEVISK
jgi:HPt (histidine-containing phosphotransfer) domain-containing protein